MRTNARPTQVKVKISMHKRNMGRLPRRSDIVLQHKGAVEYESIN